MIDGKNFDKAIVFLEDGRITTEHNGCKDGSNRTILSEQCTDTNYQRADQRAEVKLINHLSKTYCPELITATDGDGYTALQWKTSL